jgi:archaemetzincin
MKVGILQVGQVAPKVLAALAEGLPKIFPETTATVIMDVLPVFQGAFDKKRSQYNSSLLLNEVRVYATKRQQDFHRILGIVDADMYAFGLNYVFGEAYTSGAAALVSVWRLKPEFCRDQPNQSLYLLRVQKEAVHELGHTLGVKHCPRSLCVMHFSNSIFDTDKKQNLLCDECYLQAAIAISNLG